MESISRPPNPNDQRGLEGALVPCLASSWLLADDSVARCGARGCSVDGVGLVLPLVLSADRLLNTLPRDFMA